VSKGFDQTVTKCDIQVIKKILKSACQHKSLGKFKSRSQGDITTSWHNIQT
jgi:hypothetical protein